MNQIFYNIPGTNSVALTFKEEFALLKDWKLKKSQAARETLVKNYILFAVKKVGSMYWQLPEDSVLQVAHRAMLLSIDGYDHTREKVGRLCNLIPLYAKVAHRELIREEQTVKCPIVPGMVRFQSLDSTHNSRRGVTSNTENALGEICSSTDCGRLESDFLLENEEPTLSLEDLMGPAWSAMDETLQKEKLASLKECVDQLRPGYRKIIELVYFKGLNFACVARRLRPTITREAVRQRHNRAIQELRDAVRAKGIFSIS